MTPLWPALLLTAASLAAQTAPKLPAGPPNKAAAPATREVAPPTGPSYADLAYPAAKPIPIPRVETVNLPNGLRVYLLEDHELPTISGLARVRTGNLLDPRDKVGLAALTGTVMRTGGAAKQTGDEIDLALDSVAATVESTIGESEGSISFSTLKENAGLVLGVVHDVMTAPQFSQDKIDLAKTQLHNIVARRNDTAGAIVQREFHDVVYGRTTPYGWPMEHATVDAITRADLQAFYERCYFPSNVRLAIWGDFDSSDMKTRLEKLFADWNAKQDPVPGFPQVIERNSLGTFLAAKRDTALTSIVMGHLGGLFNAKDYASLEIMANILGGGPRSRLYQTVRTKMGSAFSVSANWGVYYDHPGLLEITAAVKVFSTVETIRAMLKEVERMRTEEVSEAELKSAKETTLNGLVFAFDTRSKTLSRMLTYEYYGYPMDFIQRYQKALAQVTAADVLRVAKAQLDPDSFTLVAVGNPDAFDQPLERLGKAVTPIDLTIPPPSRNGILTADAGDRILARAQQAAGGIQKLAAIKDLTLVTEFVLDPAAGGLHVKEQSRWIGPEYFRQDSEVPTGRISAYYDGKQGWIATPQGEGPLMSAQLSQVRGDLFRLYLRVLLSDRTPGRKVVDNGAGGIYIYSDAGDSARISFDKATGLLQSVSYEAVLAAGPAQQVQETYSDFRDVDGIKVPFKIAITQGAAKFADVTVTEVKLNSGLKLEELEAKPLPQVKK